jgi:UDP-N-acetylmuramate: L-alanyl-gamma-D-glutamyl-meso-diaminopimelate ligase
MYIHFIAIGGSAMHNLALALASKGYKITGSDDEIYEPSLSRLKEVGICPEKFGWFPEKLSEDIDAVVLGMHARKDNPELLKAQELGLTIMSYPEFVYEQSKDKKRVVIAGSHGKTTTTSIIIHVLTTIGIPCDYLVGAQLEGFNRMVKLTDAPIIILEGDEYLSSPIDPRSKFSHYHPDISVITGVSWDHINVFPTKASYFDRFKEFISEHDPKSTIYYFTGDLGLVDLIRNATRGVRTIGYQGLKQDGDGFVLYDGHRYHYTLIGGHNLENTRAALNVCLDLGVKPNEFFEALNGFKGAGKRLQRIFETKNAVAFLDFAHAPSKVAATTKAISKWFPQLELISVLELHTFSSLNKKFLPEYKDTLNAATEAVVFFDQHTLEMKKMPPLDPEFVKSCFAHNQLIVFDEVKPFHWYLDKLELDGKALLLMTSGNFGHYDLNKLNRW